MAIAAGPLFTFSLWLRPASSTAEHFSSIISCLASKHDAPCFPPHVTLLNAATCSKENGEDALLWLSDVAGAAEGALSLEIGDATVRCFGRGNILRDASSFSPVRTNPLCEPSFTAPTHLWPCAAWMQPHFFVR